MDFFQAIQKIVKPFNRKRYVWPLKLLVTALFVYLVNKNLGYGRIRLFEIKLAAMPLVAVLVAGLANFFFQVLRWQLVCKAYGMRIGAGLAVKTMLFGNLLAFVTPGKFGELLRGMSIPAAKKSDTVVAVAFEKVCAGIATVAAGIIAAAVHSSRHGITLGQTVIFAGGICIAVATAAVVLLASGKNARKILGRFCEEKVWPFAERFIPATDAATLWGVILYSIAAHLSVVCQTVFLFFMFGSPDISADIVCAFEAYAFMIFFPFFIANMGIREYSFKLFLSKAGAAPGAGAIAVLASVSVLAINMVLPALAGLVWWLLESRKAAEDPA
ncbi:MAG TPA: lysylphosphatidylglycerol synthase domain-containing protein [Chitinivibrionales bacterium]|nr:lysylphosphatidylglycerol synthase domain-containing protein [Chitinivibrionales bacterium]